VFDFGRVALGTAGGCPPTIIAPFSCRGFERNCHIFIETDVKSEFKRDKGISVVKGIMSVVKGIILVVKDVRQD
jgi:hypothetical protein